VVDGGAMTQQQLHNFKMAAASCTLQSCVSTLKTKTVNCTLVATLKTVLKAIHHLYSL
jgi:hypothetical protein